MFVALAGAPGAGRAIRRFGGGTAAESAPAIDAGPLIERRQSAAAIGLEAKLEQPVAVVVLHIRLRFDFGAELLFGDHAGFGEIGVGFRDRLAEPFALLAIEVFVPAPDDGRPGEFRHFGRELLREDFDGAEGFAVGTLEGFGDGLEGLRLFFGGPEARGAGDGHGGDLAGVEDFAGARGVEGFCEEALGDLGGDELDGVEVFEKRDGDVRTAGADGIAIAGVLDAEVAAAEGALAALNAADSEGATALPGQLLWIPRSPDIGEIRGTRGLWCCIGRCFGHGILQDRAQSSGHRKEKGRLTKAAFL